MSKAWTGKTAVICGASAGLGEQIAAELCRQHVGALVLLARRRQPLEACRERLLSQFPQVEVHVVEIDLADPGLAAELPARLPDQLAPIDLVVQAAGQSDRGTIQELSAERLNELINANVLTSLHAVQFLSSSMRQPGGCIVLIGSLASHFAPRYLGGYALAKHALAALAQQARLELADRQIHVMLASPGPIARRDAGSRYDAIAQAENLPDQARRPGGGAKLRGLDPERLAREILAAAAARRRLLVRPRKARLLIVLRDLWPSLADRILQNRTG